MNQYKSLSIFDQKNLLLVNYVCFPFIEQCVSFGVPGGLFVFFFAAKSKSMGISLAGYSPFSTDRPEKYLTGARRREWRNRMIMDDY